MDSHRQINNMKLCIFILCVLFFSLTFPYPPPIPTNFPIPFNHHIHTGAVSRFMELLVWFCDHFDLTRPAV